MRLSDYSMLKKSFEIATTASMKLFQNYKDGYEGGNKDLAHSIVIGETVKGIRG